MQFNTIYQRLISGEGKIALVGLGYVGMPIAVEFAKHVKVIGFDINEKRVNEYANGIDSTNEVGEAIKSTNEFRSMSTMQLKSLFKDSSDDEKVLIDVKSLYRLDELKASGMRYWRL